MQKSPRSAQFWKLNERRDLHSVTGKNAGKTKKGLSQGGLFRLVLTLEGWDVSGFVTLKTEDDESVTAFLIHLWGYFQL